MLKAVKVYILLLIVKLSKVWYSKFCICAVSRKSATYVSSIKFISQKLIDNFFQILIQILGRIYLQRY
jgi:hypothetical protein